METREWLESFASWPQPRQEQALAELVGSLNASMSGRSQIVHLQSVIRPYLRRDFISFLPEELAGYILSYLSPEDLARAGRVCRRWYQLTRNDMYWQKFCKQAINNEMETDIHNAASSNLFNGIKHELSKTQPSPISFRKAYFAWAHLPHYWRVCPLPKPEKVVAHPRHVITCMVMTENHTLVTGSNDSTLKLWNLGESRPLLDFVGHQGGVWACGVYKDKMVSASTDHNLKVWSLRTGECMHTLEGHTSTARCVRFVDNRIISGSRDGTVRHWDAETGNCLNIFRGHQGAVRCVEFNGRYAVSGSYDHHIKIWDTKDNPESECHKTLHGHRNRVYSLQFDGKYVISGALDMAIKVWDAETGICLHTLLEHNSLTGLMVLRKGILVSANADTTLKIWDVEKGTCLRTLQGHKSAVTCLTFDSRNIVSCSNDGTVKLWNAETGELTRDIVNLEKEQRDDDDPARPPAVWRVACTPCHMVCAVGCPDGAPHRTQLYFFNFMDGYREKAEGSSSNSSHSAGSPMN
eukprot:m.19965 g.19965  ORF g.19965 m.19965 type:complete len:522 (-) comp6721_c0_seq2:176-1741(-)